MKPASSDCNMACGYCYYRYVDEAYPVRDRPRMSLDVVDAVCEQYRALNPREIKIGWQGGEPTLMGLDFFRRVVEIESRHARRGNCFGNTLQTNGVLVDDEWCRFFRRHNFLVGLSVDGPGELDTLRRFRNQRPAHDVVMRTLALLKRRQVEFNVLVVISAANVEHPREVFRFLVTNDVHYAQFIPCTEPDRQTGDGGLCRFSITPAQYGDFMIGLFDNWIENDDPSYYIRGLDNWLHLFFGLRPECCQYQGDCSNLVTVEYNGDVYPCDFFVEPRFRMGNVLEKTLGRMLGEQTFRQFVLAANHVPETCRNCEWFSVCRGGCYRHRMKLGRGPDEQPYLCPANKRIFSHVFGTLKDLMERPVKPNLHRFLHRIAARLTQRGRPASQQRRREDGTRQPPGRNGLCPCGSGKKFKHCCMQKAAVLRK